MINLELFALFPVPVLVVRYLLDDLPDLRAKVLFQLLRGGIGILDGIMQNGCLQRGQIGHAAHAGEKFRHFHRVVDVGERRCTLTALIPVLTGGELDGLQYLRHRLDVIRGHFLFVLIHEGLLNRSISFGTHSYAESMIG